jgi:hypothetical protein
LVVSLAGCATANTPTAEATQGLVLCGSTNLYEAAPDAGFPTILEAFDSRIAWLRDVATKDPPTDGQTEFDLEPELETMELARAALYAQAMQREGSPGETITIYAIGAEGTDAGEVTVELLPNGYFITAVVVRTGTADTLEECP